VVSGETESSAKSVIEAFRGANVNILVQDSCRKRRARTSVRSWSEGRVVAAIQRTGAPDDFRSNLHRGGSAKAVRINKEERATALRAARTMGLNVCGVDLLRSKAGPVVVEVNSSPGLEGVEKASGRDIAADVIQFLERNARPNRTRTRGRG
jgi:ribosomal protein S6--L-glutamate ligase